MIIDQSTFEKILKKNFLFEQRPQLAVALSGGADSMSLIFLLNNWIKKNNGSLIGLIIDHKIRKNSTLEANTVKKFLSRYEIKSKLFSIENKDILKKTMNEARKNRFNKLIQFCVKKNIFHLFLGHHFDDNIETFFIRKIAGSNFEGLGSIKYKFNMNGVQILRPLLDFKKKQIIKFVKKNDIPFVEDPSNYDLKYSRVAIREYLLKNSELKTILSKELKMIKYYLPYYKKMIYQALHLLAVKITYQNIWINALIFNKYDLEIQTKIIEIIYKFLKPQRQFLRYKKILISLKNLNNDHEININLAGMTIRRDNFYIHFMT